MVRVLPMRCTVVVPPLVRVATWLTHSSWIGEARSGVIGLIVLASRTRCCVMSGCGLSGAGVAELSVETWVRDLEAVVDASGLERFSVLGVSQGAAIAVAYAERHPDPSLGSCAVRRLRAGPARAWAAREEEALIAAIRAGWTSDEPAYRHLFSMLFLPPHRQPRAAGLV